MRLQILDSANFRVAEQFVDPTSGARETGGTKVLRIYEIVWGGTWKAFDTSQSAGSKFQTSVTDANSKISLTHKTAGGLNTGIWESDAIDYTSFTAGSDYVFEFENNDDSVFQTYEVKFKGQALNADCDETITDYGLDHLVSTSVAGADVADNSIIAHMAASGGDWDTFDDAQDSLEAIRNNQAAAAAIADAVHDEAVADHVAAGSFGERSRLLQRLLEADVVVDTTTTPWQLVYYIRGAAQVVGNEIMRQNLTESDGTNVTADTQIVGQREAP